MLEKSVNLVNLKKISLIQLIKGILVKRRTSYVFISGILIFKILTHVFA